MTRAYSDLYLEHAMTSLGSMLNYAVYALNLDPRTFWNKFTGSSVAAQFEYGNPSYVAGRSGAELALMTLDINERGPELPIVPYKTEEYWAGWALAYYQWYANKPFAEINKAVPVDEVILMYRPYHETDIKQFADAMDEKLRARSVPVHNR